MIARSPKIYYLPRSFAVNRQSSDEQMLDELEAGRERLLSDASTQSLLTAWRRRLQSITRNVYIFRWIPVQAEDSYGVLVDGATVVHVEVPRHTKHREMVFESWPVDEYLNGRKSLAKRERRKLELALRLARSE